MKKYYYNRKYELILTETDMKILEYVSTCLKILYNILLNYITDEKLFSITNTKTPQLLKGRNLRNLIFKLNKDKSQGFAGIFTVLLKDCAYRIKDAYVAHYKRGTGKPKHKDVKDVKKLFSLKWDDAKKVPKIEKGCVVIKMGKDMKGKDLKIVAKVKNYKKYSGEHSVKEMIITKNKGKYYIIETIETEIEDRAAHAQSKDWIAIDPNHSNLFGAIDSDGLSYLFDRLIIDKPLDKTIDKMKKKRYKKKAASNKNKSLTEQIHKLENKKENQIKTALYTIAHYIVKKYNTIAIGDYTPSLDAAKYANMRRSMINQTHIAYFRQILAEICVKYGKKLLVVDEKNTTKECCITKNHTKRTTEERKWYIGNDRILRDINSAVNIAIKTGLKDDKVTYFPSLGTIDSHLRFDTRYGINHVSDLKALKDAIKMKNSLRGEA